MNWLNLFRKDPLLNLQREHSRWLAEAHRLSTVDRKQSDACMVKAAEVEAKLVALQQEREAAQS